jgi:hypothetical protein
MGIPNIHPSGLHSDGGGWLGHSNSVDGTILPTFLSHILQELHGNKYLSQNSIGAYGTKSMFFFTDVKSAN